MTSPFGIWSALGPFFTTSVGQVDGEDWALSNATDGGTPIWADVYTSSTTYTAGAALTYTIVLTTQDWLGDIQPEVTVATDANFVNPFGSSATQVGNIMAPILFSSSSTSGSGGILYWTNSSTAGDYAVDFRPFTVSYPSAPTSSPLTQLTGAPVTMISAIANPLGWTVATDTATSMVFAYVTANGTGENLYMEGFDNNGAATNAGPVLVASGLAKGTPYYIGYNSSGYGYRYLEIGGALGTGLVGGTFNTTTGALGAAALFLSLPSYSAFTGLASIGLSTGNTIRIIEGVANGQAVIQAFLNGSAAPTASYAISSANDRFATTTVYDPTTGKLDYTVLAYADAGAVHLELLNESGNQIGTDLVIPGISSFDRIHTMNDGSNPHASTRIEIDYTVADPNGGYEVEGFIYDTSGARTYTLSANGLYDGSPFNDTITWATGVFTIDGGGGSDTFVATSLVSSQVKLSVDPAGEVIVNDGAGDIDTLRRFTTIELSDATVTISGETLTEVFSTGKKTVTTFGGAGELLSTKTYTSGGALTGLFYTSQIPNDFTGDGRSDVLFESQTGPGASVSLVTWQMQNGTITGGGTIGAPGATWTYQGEGDFYGNGHSDVLWRNQSGLLDIWEMNGAAIVGGGSIGNPGGTFSVVGEGDLFGNGYGDILFQDANGNLAFWEMNGLTLAASGSIGNPGASYRVVGVGDFNGDGKSDILFESASGQYAIWNMSGGSISGTGVLGSPGAGWVYKGIGNFNGLGDSDILFENANTGQYATWDVTNDKITGGGSLGYPGAAESLVAIGDYATTGRSSLLFENTATGQFTSWDLDDVTVVKQNALGDPGPVYPVAEGPPALDPQPAPTITFFNATNGLYAEWDITNNVTIATSGGLGSATGYTALAVGDFNGDGQSDVLFVKNGAYATWQTNGATITGGGSLGSPGGTFVFKGVGDFNGDGKTDILFENASGVYATWDMSGTTIIGGASLGDPGSGLTYAGVGDFTGDGTSDILFTDASGNYWMSVVGQTQIVSTTEIGDPGAGFRLVGIGDLNGDGKADLLFSNAAGALSSWDLNGNTIVGGGSIGNPGSAFTVVGIADLSSTSHASIVFDNASTGQVATWLMNDTSIIGGGTIGAAAGYGVLGVS